MDGGAGNDIYNYSTTSELISSALPKDVISDLSGTADQLKLTAATSTTLTIASTDVLTGIRGVENITAGLSAGVISITRIAEASKSSANFTTIDLSGDTDILGANVISNTGLNAITTIIGSAGVDQITLGAAAPRTTVTGGAGADTLSIATTNQVTIIDTDGIAVTGSAGNETIIFSGAIGSSTTVTGDTGADTITLDNTTNILSINDATMSVLGGSGIDTIHFITTPTTAVTVNGGVGADILTLSASGNAGVTISDADGIAITGSAGIDGLTFSVAVLATTVTGAAGADTIALYNSPNVLSVADADVYVTGNANVDNVTFTLATTAATIEGAAGADTIHLGNFPNALTVKDSDFALTGGSGADTITLTNTAALSGVTIDGGEGIDSLVAIGNHADNTATFTDMNVLTLSAISTASTTGAFTIAGATATAVTAPAADSIFISTSSALTTITGTALKALALSGTGAFAVSGLTSGAVIDTGSGALTVTTGPIAQTVTTSAPTTINAAALGAATLTVGASAGAVAVTGLGSVADSTIITEETGNTGALTVTTALSHTVAVTEAATGVGAAVTVNAAGTGVVTWTALAAHSSHTATVGAGASLVVDVASTATAYGVTLNSGTSGTHVYTNSSTTSSVDTINATNAVGLTTIKPGLGNDVITLGAATDKFVFSGGTVVAGAAPTAHFTANGADVITGFSSSDLINVAALGDGSTIATGLTTITTAGSKVALANDIVSIISTTGGAANLTTSGLLVVSDWTSMASVSAYLNEHYSVASSANQDVIIINNTAGSNDTSYVYTLSNSAADTTIDAGDIVLVGTINHTAGTVLTTSNVVYS